MHEAKISFRKATHAMKQVDV